MRRVLATAGHVDHGKSTLVRVLTGRDPDRLEQERARGLTIELGFAWTRLPSGADLAFVDVPGHQRFIGTTLAGLGPTPAVVFVVAADQGWAAQSSEHLAAVRALGVRDGLLVLTRSDLTDATRIEAVRAQAEGRLAAAGLQVPSLVVSARTGAGLDDLRGRLDDLVARLPQPDAQAPVRLWCDRSFTIAGAGTVVTGTLGAGTLHTGEELTLLSGERSRPVVVRGLQSQDVAHETLGPVSRVAVNLRRTDADQAGRSCVLVDAPHYELARVIDVTLESVDPESVHSVGGDLPPERVMLHVGSVSLPVHVRPLGARHARVTLPHPLPWWVGDRAILRDPGDRRLWSALVADVDPLPLRRRGAARRRGEALEGSGSPADRRLAERQAEHPEVLRRLGLPEPTQGVRVGQWWVAPEALSRWQSRLARHLADHQARHPLSHGVPVAQAAHSLELPDHLRLSADGGELPAGLPPLAPDLVAHLARAAGLTVAQGRVRGVQVDDLGPAEAAVAAVAQRLRSEPFAAPERDELRTLGLGPHELAAAARAGRLLRLPGDIVILPDGPARAMRELAALEQPFTLSAARRALGTTRRVAIPLLEHLDERGWTRRVDGNLRQVVQPPRK